MGVCVCVCVFVCMELKFTPKFFPSPFDWFRSAKSYFPSTFAAQQGLSAESGYDHLDGNRTSSLAGAQNYSSLQYASVPHGASNDNTSYDHLNRRGTGEKGGNVNYDNHFSDSNNNNNNGQYASLPRNADNTSYDHLNRRNNHFSDNDFNNNGQYAGLPRSAANSKGSVHVNESANRLQRGSVFSNGDNDGEGSEDVNGVGGVLNIVRGDDAYAVPMVLGSRA